MCFIIVDLCTDSIRFRTTKKYNYKYHYCNFNGNVKKTKVKTSYNFNLIEINGKKKPNNLFFPS